MAFRLADSESAPAGMACPIDISVFIKDGFSEPAFAAVSRQTHHAFSIAPPDPDPCACRRGAAVVRRDGAGARPGSGRLDHRPAEGHPGPDRQDRRSREENTAGRRGRCHAGRYPAAAGGSVAGSADQCARLPFASHRHQQPDRDAGAAAGRGPAAGARHRHRRTPGAGVGKGRDQRRHRQRAEPVDPHQRPDRQDRQHAQRAVPQPADQALRTVRCAEPAGRSPTPRTNTSTFTGRCRPG